jgi:hypothetical protein
MLEKQQVPFKPFSNESVTTATSTTKARAVSKQELTEDAIKGKLFKEMRELPQTEIIRTDLATGEDWIDSCNKYDHEVDKYTNSLVFGDFSDPNTPKPEFKLDHRDFSAELKENLVEQSSSREYNQALHSCQASRCVSGNQRQAN